MDQVTKSLKLISAPILLHFTIVGEHRETASQPSHVIAVMVGVIVERCSGRDRSKKEAEEDEEEVVEKNMVP